MMREPVSDLQRNLLVEFVKSILRAQLYSLDHEQGKAGLQTFDKALRRTRNSFVYLSLGRLFGQNQKSAEVAGIGEGQTRIHKIIGGSMATTFELKIAEFLERNHLAALTLRNQISIQEFSSFLRFLENGLPTDPRQWEKHTLDCFARENIVNISLLFEPHEKQSGRILPWRVDIALHRLRKDLGNLPIYKSLSAERMAEVRQQILWEVMHGLGNPELIGKFILNFDLVKEKVPANYREGLENSLMAALRPDMLKRSLDWIDLAVIRTTSTEYTTHIPAETLRANVQPFLTAILNAMQEEPELLDPQLVFDLCEHGWLKRTELPRNIAVLVKANSARFAAAANVSKLLQLFRQGGQNAVQIMPTLADGICALLQSKKTGELVYAAELLSSLSKEYEARKDSSEVWQRMQLLLAQRLDPEAVWRAAQNEQIPFPLRAALVRSIDDRWLIFVITDLLKKDNSARLEEIMARMMHHFGAKPLRHFGNWILEQPRPAQAFALKMLANSYCQLSLTVLGKLLRSSSHEVRIQALQVLLRQKIDEELIELACRVCYQPGWQWKDRALAAHWLLEHQESKEVSPVVRQRLPHMLKQQKTIPVGLANLLPGHYMAFHKRLEELRKL